MFLKVTSILTTYLHQLVRVGSRVGSVNGTISTARPLSNTVRTPTVEACLGNIYIYISAHPTCRVEGVLDYCLDLLTVTL